LPNVANWELSSSVEKGRKTPELYHRAFTLLLLLGLGVMLLALLP